MSPPTASSACSRARTRCRRGCSCRPWDCSSKPPPRARRGAPRRTRTRAAAEAPATNGQNRVSLRAPREGIAGVQQPPAKRLRVLQGAQLPQQAPLLVSGRRPGHGGALHRAAQAPCARDLSLPQLRRLAPDAPGVARNGARAALTCATVRAAGYSSSEFAVPLRRSNERCLVAVQFLP